MNIVDKFKIINLFKSISVYTYVETKYLYIHLTGGHGYGMLCCLEGWYNQPAGVMRGWINTDRYKCIYICRD